MPLEIVHLGLIALKPRSGVLGQGGKVERPLVAVGQHAGGTVIASHKHEARFATEVECIIIGIARSISQLRCNRSHSWSQMRSARLDKALCNLLRLLGGDRSRKSNQHPRENE